MHQTGSSPVDCHTDPFSGRHYSVQLQRVESNEKPAKLDTMLFCFFLQMQPRIAGSTCQVGANI
eukprot:6472448-Amphidinium_carterae.2